MSELISTGGGHNHPAGCTCPFCQSTAHGEPAGVDLEPPAKKPTALEVVADNLEDGPVTSRNLVQAALARECSARVGLEHAWVDTDGQPTLHQQYPGGVAISKPLSGDLADDLSLVDEIPEADRNGIILRAMRDSRELDEIALAAGLRTSPRRPDAALDWEPTPTQVLIVNEPTDDEDGSLECPSCGSASIHEVDRSIRWNDAEYGGDGLVNVHGADNHNATVGYRCGSCWTWLDLPEDTDVAWS